MNPRLNELLSEALWITLGCIGGMLLSMPAATAALMAVLL